MIKTVFIDIDNTLLDFYKSSKKALKSAFHDFEIAYKEEYLAVFHKINDGLWRKIENGTLTREELFKIRFNAVFDALGISADGIGVEKAYRKYLFETAIPVDGAEDILKYLSGKYAVYAASNAIYDQQINRLTKAGLIGYFDGVFVSEKLGFQKPSKEFYDECFKLAGGINPAQTVMIGDSLTADIEGGKNYGMVTVWYNHMKATPSVGVTPDYAVNSLVEIKNIL